jgi:hypothetical protein
MNHKNLITLLKIFKNRPYHLTKYLLDNGAFTEDFLKKLEKSDRLRNLSIENEDINAYFLNISQMEEFYNNLLEESKNLPGPKQKKEIEKDLNQQLSTLIKEERYEEAAIIRDYMINLGIKRKN